MITTRLYRNARSIRTYLRATDAPTTSTLSVKIVYNLERTGKSDICFVIAVD